MQFRAFILCWSYRPLCVKKQQGNEILGSIVGQKELHLLESLLIQQHFGIVIAYTCLCADIYGAFIIKK